MAKKIQLGELNRALILIVTVELVVIVVFALNFYRGKSAPPYGPKTEVSLCLEEGRRYRIEEALQNPRACNIEISSDQDLAKLAAASLNLTNVQSIYFRKTPNTDLPGEIGNLKNLTVLIFHHTFNTTLPSEIDKLKKLTVLKLDQADIEDIPAEIGNLDSLKSLIIINNAKKVNMSSEIAKLENLETLDLSNSNFTELPEGIVGLTKLKSLNLSGNSLDQNEIENLRQSLPKTQIIYLSSH